MTTVQKQKIHLAIIPDGNRRWAKQKGLMAWKGHKKATDNFHAILEWCRKSEKIDVLTVWCFSTENWKRSQKEVDKLMEIFEQYISSERETLAKRNIRLVHSGRKDRIPKSLRELIEKIEEETKTHTGCIFHIALDYGGKDEIVRTCEKIYKKNEELSEETIRQNLDQPLLPDIDLIIRTSGEQRTSNFFLWQGAYAEWIFVEKYFPEFTEKDVETSLVEYEDRTRRYGA